MNNKNDGQATGPGLSRQMPQYNSPKNWKEPLQDQENVYACLCYQCGYAFFGDKRAMICKECDAENKERSRMADEYPALLAEVTRLREENERLREALATILHESSGDIRPVAIKVIKKVAANSLRPTNQITMTKPEIKSRIEQLLTLYYLSREVMGRDYDENKTILEAMKTDCGLCISSHFLFGSRLFPQQYLKCRAAYRTFWWNPSCSVETVRAQRRAIEVRIKFLEKELNKYV